MSSWKSFVGEPDDVLALMEPWLEEHSTDEFSMEVGMGEADVYYQWSSSPDRHHELAAYVFDRAQHLDLEGSRFSASILILAGVPMVWAKVEGIDDFYFRGCELTQERFKMLLEEETV